jgi:hypothetical protein
VVGGFDEGLWWAVSFTFYGLVWGTFVVEDDLKRSFETKEVIR